METDPVFTRFVERRGRLLDRLDQSRAQFDAWLDKHRTLAASVADLAQLEGLLAERRNTLTDLLNLDDSLLNHLVMLLGRNRGGTDSSD